MGYCHVTTAFGFTGMKLWRAITSVLNPIEKDRFQDFLLCKCLWSLDAIESFQSLKTMLLLTESVVHTRKYLLWRHAVRTERSEVRAAWRHNKYFPYGPNSRLVRALLYTHTSKTTKSQCFPLLLWTEVQPVHTPVRTQAYRLALSQSNFSILSVFCLVYNNCDYFIFSGEICKTLPKIRYFDRSLLFGNTIFQTVSLYLLSALRYMCRVSQKSFPVRYDASWKRLYLRDLFLSVW